MADPDLNLLPALAVLLREGSVAGAARVLGLSDSAMSRTLLRLRDATGDALLVRAGRRLVPTPHALALRDRVHALADDARAVLRPAINTLDLRSLDIVFTLRANEGFIETFAARLVAALAEVAPGVQLRFAPKPDKGVQALRDGAIDLEIGVLGDTGPEVKVQALFQDRFVGVVRQGHALVSGPVTPERYAACGHVVASRRGRSHGPVDEALAVLGLARRVAVTVPSFPAAMAVAASSELVGLVTQSFVRERPNGLSVYDFALPIPTAPITVSQMWHPRVDADPAHRWLRETVLFVCRPRQAS
jgi:DNA-binding transcriptional LysR family regulator